MGRSGNPLQAVLRGAGVLMLILAVTACSPIIRKHGFVPPEDEIASLQIGVDTRETVLTLFGPPSASGVLPDSSLYYVTSTFREFGLARPQEIDRQVVAVTFDRNGRLANVVRYGLEDGQVVALSRRVTDESIADKTFIRQLLGNFGRVDASALAPG